MSDPRHAPGTCNLCDSDRRSLPVLKPGDPGPIHTESIVDVSALATAMNALIVAIVLGSGIGLVIAALLGAGR